MLRSSSTLLFDRTDNNMKTYGEGRSPSPPLNFGTSYLMTLGAVTHTMVKGLSRGKSSAVNFYSGILYQGDLRYT